ncbi:eukaryotic type KH-domain (KH-domain type I) [Wallemia mellicola]|nr:eukaryotic type KH-domain (KH-domain type I) [Wallemia mellicola]
MSDNRGHPASSSAAERRRDRHTYVESFSLDQRRYVSILLYKPFIQSTSAGIIIGKGGKNVADLRERTGVKAGVSKVIAGVHERVLSITGSTSAIADAFSIIAQTILDNPLNPSTAPLQSPPSATTAIRLLISHNLMGTVIGRQGIKIKQIQDTSGVRMVASKELLPQSTERIVEVQGTVESIHIAINDIAKCLLEDWDRYSGTILYTPAPPNEHSLFNSSFNNSSIRSINSVRRPDNFNMQSLNSALPQPRDVRTQHISIPSDMVGPIIGRAGSRISEIRRLSTAKIIIAKQPHDETGERLFTIIGTPEANEKALILLYSQLENEKERRIRGDAEA